MWTWRRGICTPHQSPGGGGWANPMARAPDLVLRDRRDGVVSPEAALETYGVVWFLKT